VDAEVEALARAMRLGEASDLARDRGDLARAFEIALEARDEARLEGVACAIADRTEKQDRNAIADRARAAAIRRGDAAAEGMVAEAMGATDEAAALYERAGSWRRAAAIWKAKGDVARAGRALERQVRADPTDAGSRVSLGDLLCAAGKHEAALRAVASLEGDDARAIRARAHAGLGLQPAEPTQSIEGVTAAVRATTDASLLFGRYEVVREVASTASSRVLEAIDRLLPGRDRVALKIFTGGGQVGAGRDALARFHREMDVLTHVDAPSILHAREVLQEGPTIVLPWMSGGSVADLIARGPVPPDRAAEIVARVLQALEAAHRRGIVHRDVKPANVLLDEVGGAYLADFGVAHLGDASSTATAGLLGTLRYMSPEQKMGTPATDRADVYAAGLILSEMLGAQIDRVPIPTDVPTDVATLLAELLADDPTRRPDAATARAKVLATAWPDRPFALARVPSELPPPSSFAPKERFVEETKTLRRDAILEREEILVFPGDPHFALAKALASITDPHLPMVLGVDAATGAIRIERVVGEPTESHEGATSALSRLASVTGVDAMCIILTARGIVAAFPSPP
jgi:serine/threonine-protein kinase